MTSTATDPTPASPLRADGGVDEMDGRPVSGYQPGDALPGGVAAWARLGVGHRCETWLAWSDELFQPVVVKFPRPDQLDHPRARRSLVREVAALAGNLHPVLPRLYVDGTGETAVPHVVLEYIDGPALDDANDAAVEQPAPGVGEVEVAILGVQLLSALRTVHRRGLVHVDIKPANVVLRDGRPVLLDFGSARAIGSPQPAGLLIGSGGYAAPELEAGAAISPTMDVYGLGVTLWEARTGAAAFDPDVAAADRPTLPPAGDGPLTSLLAALTDPDPTARPDVDQTLAALAVVADPDGDVVWPQWRREQNR